MNELIHIFRLRMSSEVNICVEQLLLNRRKTEPRTGKNEVLLGLIKAGLEAQASKKTTTGSRKPTLRARRSIYD